MLLAEVVVGKTFGYTLGTSGCGFSSESIKLRKIEQCDNLVGRQTGCRNTVLESNSFLGGYHIVDLLARHLMRLAGGTIVAVINGPTTKVDGLVKLFRDIDEEDTLAIIL